MWVSPLWLSALHIYLTYVSEIILCTAIHNCLNVSSKFFFQIYAATHMVGEKHLENYILLDLR